MNNQTNDNLKDLLGRFMTSEGAEQAAEDIAAGERILGQNPAPAPSEQLVADIRTRLGQRLKKRGSFARTAFRTLTAAAAAIIILAVVRSVIFKRTDVGDVGKGRETVISAAVWESNELVKDDTELAILADEIEELSIEIFAITLDENGGNGTVDLTELEDELIEISGYFWEG